MMVREVMTTEVASIRDTATIKEAAGALVDRRVSGLPVVDDAGAVVGVISEADFVRAAGHSGALRNLLTRLFDPGPDRSDSSIGKVRDVMTSPARTITPHEPVSRAAALMGKWGVNRLPVVDRGQLVGIISRADIVGLYTRTDDALRAAAAQAVSDFPGLEVLDVRDGVAFLSGTTDQRAVAETARLIVAQMPGVVAVDASAVAWARDR